MGGQCSGIQSAKREYQLVKQFDHYSLGLIKVIKKIGTQNSMRYSGFNEQIGMKVVQFDSSARQKQYLSFLNEIKEFQNIPTLVKILSYESKAVENQRINNTSRNNRKFHDQQKIQADITNNNNMFGFFNPNCLEKYSTAIFFQFHEHTLLEAMHKKHTILTQINKQKQNLRKSQRYDEKSQKLQDYWLFAQIKLCNYEAIDLLAHHQRKIINMYYQEVQILRMIDHIIGALYFLHHFGHPHGAACPENIMIDSEGKYVLIDPHVFCMPTNYEKAIKIFTQIRLDEPQQESHRKIDNLSFSQNKQLINYISPELFNHLKLKHIDHKESAQKIDIYSVGIIALKMCLIDLDISQKIINNGNVQIVRSEITKLLLIARKRYSCELIQLLREMLQFSPSKRIDYSTLIDKLHPLLTQNLDRIQKIYNAPSNNQNTSSLMNTIIDVEIDHEIKSRQLAKRLSEFESKYQRVMNNSIMMSEKYEPFNRQVIMNDERSILKQLQRVSKQDKASNNKNQKGITRKVNSKRQMKGTQLYDIYLSQYQEIKKKRNYV